MAESSLHPIRVRSHLLHLLGEELIGDERLAIFELVKNGYDADAKSIDITVVSKGDMVKSITVQDSGTGMTLEEITGKWLELATDSRRKDRDRRTPVFHRMPLGEKGIGRIASFKLGRFVELTTRAAGNPEYQAEIDWDNLLKRGAYLEDLAVRVRKNDTATIFHGDSTGTRIVINGLRREQWTRGDLRKLYRLVSSLASPFDTPDEFMVRFKAPGRENDLVDLIEPNKFLDLAVWKFDFSVIG